MYADLNGAHPKITSLNYFERWLNKSIEKWSLNDY